jgi:hypothetical protein
MDEFAGEEWVNMVWWFVFVVTERYFMVSRDTTIVRRLDSVCGVLNEVEV